MITPRPPYGLILADPPWAFRTHSGRDRTPTQKKFPGASRHGAGTANISGGDHQDDHYPTMSAADLAALPVASIAAKDSLLAMWTVGSHLDAALELGQAWGFTFVTDLFYWAKQKLTQRDQIDLFTGDIPAPKISMGYHTRKQLEPCLLFKRGRGLPVRSHAVRQLILAPPREHSRKPAEQYDRLSELYGDTVPRIELFSRTPRAGWDSWGNEVGKFEEELV